MPDHQGGRPWPSTTSRWRRQIDATHRFYTEAMGFELVKTVVAPTPEGGWAKHVFYDTGGDG